MNRGIASALFVATAALLGAQKSSTVDREKLDLIRRMSPEERAKLKARLEELKKLPVEERERLSQNLQKIKSMPLDEVKKLKEKEQRLSPDEQKQYADLAQGFFHWARRQGYADGFPRGVFFAWLKRERAEKMKEIRDMEAGVGSPRVDEFVRLFYEFRDVTLTRTEQHVKHHKCAPAESIVTLRDSSPREFWPKWAELQKGCTGRKAGAGPLAPRK